MLRRGQGQELGSATRWIRGRTVLVPVSMLVLLSVAATTATTAGAAASDVPQSVTPYSGFDGSLTRAPYVTDLTQTSALINWATSSSTPGSVKVAPMAGGTCPSSTTTWSSSALAVPTSIPLVSGGATTTPWAFTVTNGANETINEYQASVPAQGLAPSTAYCYAVFSTNQAGASDLLPPSKAYQTFTTLDPVSTSSTTPVTFDVMADTGENFAYTSSTSDVPFAGADPNNPINPNQAAIYQQIGRSGARFLLIAGDVAYNGGNQSTYGDLQQTGGTPPAGSTAPEVSNVFGPSYFPQTGGIPTFTADGNHGQNVTTLKVWPTSTTAASSGGTYAFNSYSGVDGISGSFPDAWYAFSTGNVRIYVIDGAWSDGTNGPTGTGNATGSLCPTPSYCEGYQADADEHWQTNSPEYQWLKADLAAHPGGIKFAVMHYPVRSVNATQPSDPYIQNDSSTNPHASTSLEKLLTGNGVQMSFNGHAHTYQRIVPDNYQQKGQLISYVTGGGGGVLEPVTGGSCNAMVQTANIYALGFSPNGGTGTSCGQQVPAGNTVAAADVFNYLQVTVTGNTVTVVPHNAAGATFDRQVYNFSPNAPPTTPSEPGGGGSSPGGSGGATACVAHLPAGSVVGGAATRSGTGYYEADTAGDVAAFGSAVCYGAMTGTPLNQPIVGMATDASGLGYWLVARDGGIFSFGDAQFHGSTGGIHLNQPIVGMASDATGQGYWLVASDGGIFAFGDAVFHGSTGGIHLNRPVVGMTADASGQGYWLVATDGGIFSFGDAVFHGSTGGIHLNKPVVGMASDASGLGYWLVASDGGIFSFGDAVFHGSTGGIRLNEPVVGMASDASGQGYWLMASDGGIFAFGDAPFLGSAA
jgi:Calcineurin-like phosphoesterase